MPPLAGVYNCALETYTAETSHKDYLSCDEMQDRFDYRDAASAIARRPLHTASENSQKPA